MRLLTHNYMQSNVRGTEKGYPLIIELASTTATAAISEGEAANNIDENDNSNNNNNDSTEGEGILLELSPVDRALALRLLPKLNYSALVSATKQVMEGLKQQQQEISGDDSPERNEKTRQIIQILEQLPMEPPKEEDLLEEVSYDDEDDDDNENDADDNNNNDGDDKSSSVTTILYRILFDIHILEGFLICPDTKRKFPIKEGIPNMILHEDEV